MSGMLKCALSPLCRLFLSISLMSAAATACSGPKTPEQRLQSVNRLVREAEKICGLEAGSIGVSLADPSNGNTLRIHGGCPSSIAPFLACGNLKPSAPSGRKNSQSICRSAVQAYRSKSAHRAVQGKRLQILGR